MITKKIIFFLIIFFVQIYQSNSSEVKIVYKVNNEILTNIDIANEGKYLLIVNTNLKNLNKNELYELSKNSLIRQILKKEEVEKYFKLEKHLVLRLLASGSGLMPDIFAKISSTIWMNFPSWNLWSESWQHSQHWRPVSFHSPTKYFLALLFQVSMSFHRCSKQFWRRAPGHVTTCASAGFAKRIQFNSASFSTFPNVLRVWKNLHKQTFWTK